VNIVAEMTLAAMRERGVEELPRYARALILACDADPPPFGTRPYGETFRQVAVNPSWLAASLIANAEREGDGAGRLWSLAACTSGGEVAPQIQQHAIDESRHARWYGAVLDLTFPEALDPVLREAVSRLSPGYTTKTPLRPVEDSPFAHEVTVDDLIQMNIAEIRTRIHQLLQRPALMVHCAVQRHRQLLSLLDALASDELTHVVYTARLIDAYAARGRAEAELVTDLMLSRVRDFNELTRAEFEVKTFAPCEGCPASPGAQPRDVPSYIVAASAN